MRLSRSPLHHDSCFHNSRISFSSVELFGLSPCVDIPTTLFLWLSIGAALGLVEIAFGICVFARR
jgi:hypothetical protein